MVRHLVIWSAVACLLAGCSAAPTWTPGPIVTLSPSPASAGPDASGNPSGTPTPTQTETLSVPTTSKAINANRYDSAHFASPSGRIWCAVYADNALCHFPRGMDTAAVPPSDQVCPGEELDVTGVSVDATNGAEYFCSGGVEALPRTNSDYVKWWKDAGNLPSVKYDGQKLAALPYGKKLRKGDYVCLSEKIGVTCGDVATGKGFRVALAGVTFIG